MINKYTFVFTLTLALTLNAQIYLDPNAAVDTRVEDLISRMTLDEKVGQMTQADHAAISNIDDVKNYYLGSLLSGGGSDPVNGNSAVNWADLYDSFQQVALQSRLKIPIIYGIDAVHGHSNVTGAVIFPHNIGLGATRNANLVEQAARITAIEIAATGIDWTFAPCIAVPRDERWGRTYEGFAETPELVSLLGDASIKGLQTDNLNNPTSIAACAKHYVGDGGTLGGVDQGNAVVSEEKLRAIHLPAYISAIENDVKTIMASYNSWNGEKLHGQAYLLNDVLKTELGFEGFIVSDWAAIDQLPGDYTSDVEKSINAGIDMVMVPNQYQTFFNTLKSLVEQEKISLQRIDDAVRRILRVKFELGLFERPYSNRSLLALVGSSQHREVGRQCVRESQVLLKKNDNVLPLPKSGIKVLVAGEHADNIGLQCGGWTIQWLGESGEITQGTTVLEGLEKTAPDVEFIYNQQGNFNEPQADYAVVVVGEQPYAEGSGDSNDLSLPDSQIELVRKMKKMGLPVITLVISGRPMIINSIIHNSDVLFASWLPGTEGDGIADILFGDYNPTGKLPMTWQKSMNDIPLNFGDVNYDPLFEYGFGITSLDDSESGSSPIINSALLNEDGSLIELSFNKSMENENNTQAVFQVLINGQQNVDILDFEIAEFDKKIILLRLNYALTTSQNLTVSYNSGNLLSSDGGVLAAFQDIPVIDGLSAASLIHNIPGKIEAEDYADMFGIQTETTNDEGGGINVGWIDANDWMDYNVSVAGNGTYNITYRVAAQQDNGILSLFKDDNELSTTFLPVTGGWQNWQSVTRSVELPGGDYILRLSALEGGFNINWFSFDLVTTVEENIPSEYFLAQNYPNPFNPSTTISFTIPENNHIRAEKITTLEIYDILGKKVKTLLNEQLSAGSYKFNFDASLLVSGIYFYRLTQSNNTIVKSMLLLK